MRYIKLILLAGLVAGTVTVAGCEFIGDVVRLQAADFYETDAGELIVCLPGTGPPANARFVGTGQTTIPPRAC